MNFYQLKKVDFATKIGINPSNLSKIINGDRSAGEAIRNKIILAFDNLNRDWLLTGEGEMLRTTPAPAMPTSVIKYFPRVGGSMGGVEFTDAPVEQWEPMQLPGFTDCEYACNAYGDSMSPLIRSGQIIVLKQWTENFIEWGRIYLIITKNGHRAVKYLKKGRDEETLLCVSENPEFEPFEVKKTDIINMYIVKGWVCRDII